jgi:hypothetical protein
LIGDDGLVWIRQASKDISGESRVHQVPLKILEVRLLSAGWLADAT